MAEELNRIMSTLVEAVTCTGGNQHPCLGHIHILGKQTPDAMQGEASLAILW